MKISISRARTSDGLESVFAQLPSSIEDVTVELPLTVTYEDILVKHQVMFLLATIRQRTNVFRLRLHIERLEVEDVNKDFLLFAGIYLADFVELASGRSLAKAEDCQALLKLSAAGRRKPKRNTQGEYYTTASQRIIAADELDASLLPLIFYRADGSLAGVQTYQDRLKAVWSPMKLSGSMRTVEDVSRILWELFENTHIHARTTRSRDLVKRSLRGCLLDYQQADQVKPNSVDHPVRKFIEGARLSGASQFLFMTIFDSGIGIPEHRRPENLVGATVPDVQLVRECFEGVPGGMYNRNRGLPTVASILKGMDIPGAAFIRSGSVSAMVDSSGFVPTSALLDGRTGTQFSVVLPYSASGFRSSK